MTTETKLFTHPAANYILNLFAPEELVCLTLIDQAHDSAVKNTFMSAAELASENTIARLMEENAAGWSVYASLQPFKPGSARRLRDNIAGVRRAFLDIDHDGAAAFGKILTSNLVPEPHYVFETSPDKLQLVWNVDSSMSLDELEELLGALIQSFGGDPQCKDAARVFRLPGFVNTKKTYAPGNPIVALKAQPFDLAVPYPRDAFKITAAAKVSVKKSDFVPDSQFEALKQRAGWAPLIRRMNAMPDARFHVTGSFDTGAGYQCPFHEHKNFSPQFGPIAGNPSIVKCLGRCPDGDNAWDVISFVRKFDNLPSMEVAARTICEEEGLAYEELFPRKPVIVGGVDVTAPKLAVNTPESSSEAASVVAIQTAAQTDFDALNAKCDEIQEAPLNPYPVDAWADTPYLLFAQTCRGETQLDEAKRNFIPPEFLINALMTMTGAICGHRIFPTFKQKVRSRFITLMVSEKGGIGKNETTDWCRELYRPTNLMFNRGPASLNIGCFTSGFGSARGMLEKFMEFPAILQEYGELTTLFEKFNIQGSGESFRDLILDLADGHEPNWSVIKGLKIPDAAPKAIHNSILGSTTEARWKESTEKGNWETFIQRSNIIPSAETRTTFQLSDPDLTEVRKLLLPRVMLLETHKLIWDYSPEARDIGVQWHKDLQQRNAFEAENEAEVGGRIQVHLMRLIGHLALCLAPLPTSDAPIQKGMFDEDGSYVDRMVHSEEPDREWRVTVTPDIVRRAIKIAEHQMVARRDHLPTRGQNPHAVVENRIQKWTCRLKQMRWVDMKRRSNINSYGYDVCDRALRNVERTGLITVRRNPSALDDQRQWVVKWIGGQDVTWTELRGGSRKGSGRKRAAKEN